VFPYWWDFGRFYKKENGIYVPDDELVRLALISFEERRVSNVWFDMFLDVKKYGWEGVFKRNNEKWNYILRENEIKKKMRRNSSVKNDENIKQLELWDK